jgi:molybdenum cofactor synthesis domain-containing protein
MRNKTASIIIIGNEILSGRTQDTNVKFLANELNLLGIKVIEVAVIPDIKQAIIDKVREFSNKFTYVFTTGGIGPTHDDITSEAIADFAGVPLELNLEARGMIESYYKSRSQEVNDARLKMAYIPKEARLIKNSISGAPGFIIKNIYVMAGVPHIMQSMFQQIEPFLERGEPIKSLSLEVLIGESKIAKEFGQLQDKYPSIEMGSYPFENEGGYATTLVLRSSDLETLTRAFNELKSIIDNLGFRNNIV